MSYDEYGGGFLSGGGHIDNNPTNNNYSPGNPSGNTNIHNSGSGSNSKGGNNSSNKGPQTLTPITIHTLNTLTMRDGKGILDNNVQLGQISLIGLLDSVEEQRTNVNYSLSDGTGFISGRLYIDSDDVGSVSNKMKSSIRENEYVQIIGNLRIVEQKRTIIIFQIRPVTDHNEITFHNLHAIATHC
jgi:replication factor A2